MGYEIAAGGDRYVIIALTKSSLISFARKGVLVENGEVCLQATNSLTRFNCPKTGNGAAGVQHQLLWPGKSSYCWFHPGYCQTLTRLSILSAGPAVIRDENRRMLENSVPDVILRVS